MWAAKDTNQCWVTSKCTPVHYYKHSRTHLQISADASCWCCPGWERICSPWLPRRSCFHLGSAEGLNSYTHHPQRTLSLIVLLHLNTHTQAKYYFKYAASVQNKKRTKKLVIRQSFRFHTYTLNLRVKFLQFIQNSSCIPHMECIFKTSKTWHTNQPFTTCQFAWPEGFPGRAQRSLTSVFTYKTLYMPFCSKYNHYICIFNLKWLMSMAVTLSTPQYSTPARVCKWF